MKDYYIIKFIFKDKEHFCIWYNNDKDGIISEKNKLTCFSGINKLLDYCKQNLLEIKEENAVSEYNIDKVIEWLSGEKTIIDCEFILDIWNIVSDATYSTKNNFLGDSKNLTSIYEKLFCGNNLPAINKSENRYEPVWNSQEIAEISNVLNDIVHFFEIQFCY
jgi:hypothetical protein